MTQGHSPALEQALAAYRSPGLYLRLRERALPDDLLLVLRVAAGDTQALEYAQSVSGEASSELREAAVMFIQQLMFSPGSDSYRVLGVVATAADSQIKEHYRWLLRWLHPDRNDDEWDAIYADRVTLAWQDLRSPERRREFERRTVEAQLHAQSVQPAPTSPARRNLAAQAQPYAPDGFSLSPRTVRRLPMLVLIGFTSVAAIVFGLLYYPVMEGATRTTSMEGAALPGRTTAKSAVQEHPVIPVAEPVLQPAASVAEFQAPPPPKAADTQRALPPAEPAPSKPAARTKVSATAMVTPAAPRNLPSPRRPATKLATLQDGEAIPVSAPVQSPPPAQINDAIARDLILRFRSAYASGNINQIRSLLIEAPGENSGEREAILRNYRKLFESSVSRHMEIRDASLLLDRDSAVLIASFEAWIQPSGKSEERRINGDIRFDLRSENGELRIVRVRHVAKGS